MFVSRFCAAVAGVMLLAPFFAYSGTLDSPAAPTGTGSAMYTLTDIYNRLDTGTATAKRTGAFAEPSSVLIATATGKTLDDVMGLVNSRAPVEKTGQTTSYVANDDGALQRGLAWPSQRFTDNTDGTVKDNLTGLTWLRDASASGVKNWANALSYCNNLAHGMAGLTDGSVVGDWRLPNVKELQSLINYGTNTPALPIGHPFSVVPGQLNGYWSGTTYSVDPNNAWYVILNNGKVANTYRTATAGYVWPVRAGQ